MTRGWTVLSGGWGWADVDGLAVGTFEGEGVVGGAFDLVAGLVNEAVVAGRAFAAGPAARDVAEADDP